MVSWFSNSALAWWKPIERCVRSSDDVADSHDVLLWYTDIDRHSAGEFSMAAVQANRRMEDYSQVESGIYGTFVGVYDGHNGPEAARFIKKYLYSHFIDFASEQGGMSFEVLQKAINATEEGFVSLVAESWANKPQIAAIGSCCLVGVICDGTLYVANVGDSRAVLGSITKMTGTIYPLQLTTEHNVAHEAVRQELKSLHPDDSHIVMLKHGVWRVKGIIQGIARRLVRAALQEAAKKREMRYADLRKVDRGIRRHLHDDITVIVVFLDYKLIQKASASM